MKTTKAMKKSVDRVLAMTEDDLMSLGCVTTNNHNRPNSFIDRGSSVLGVAHVDFVGDEHRKPRWDGSTITSNRLDDRLGVWLMLNYLPSIGINFDLLLTTDEEIGQSTAEHFQPQKQYNWMFQFDRRGDDVVMYDYESDECVELLIDYSFEVGRGSFSDICMLGGLGCRGFNFGTGYHNEHTPNCHANLKHTLKNAKKFAKFFREVCNVHLQYEQEELYDDYQLVGTWPCLACNYGLDTHWNFCPMCGCQNFSTEDWS